jgi:hypothetical protein
LEVVVESVTEVPTGAVYLVRASFPGTMYPPSRLVGPIEGGAWGHLIGESGGGTPAYNSEVGKPQLQYQVWLEQGVLEQVTLRCSRSAYVTQLWLVTDKRRCIYSELAHI